MAKKIEFKPNCIIINAGTWEALRNRFSAENVIGYLILKVNIDKVTYSVHKVNGMNTLDENSEKVSLCLGSQIADIMTLKCDKDATDFFVRNHGNFVFRINYGKGVIHDGSLRFEDLDWADKNDRLQSYLDEVFEDQRSV